MKNPKNKEISIRKLRLSDSAQLARLADNIEIWNNLRDFMPHPYREKEAEFFINLTKDQEPAQTFGIEFGEELCGVVSLIKQEDIYRKSAELGYWIGEPYQNKGIASKAVGLITSYGFEKLGLQRIFAGVFEYNLGSMRVLEKNGYRKEGIFRKAVFKNKAFWDEHRYFILKDSFLST